MSSLFNDTENDLPLHPRGAESMRTTSEMRESGRRAGSDREFTLSTGTVLGIFLALALLCVGFFGFGYSMGRKSAQSSIAVNSGSDTDTISAASGTSKPSPGSPAPQPVPGYAGAIGATIGPNNGPAVTRPKPVEDKPASADADTVAVEDGPPTRVSAASPSTEKLAATGTARVETAAKPVPAAARTVPAPVIRVPSPSPVASVPAASAVAGSPPSPAGTFVQIVAVSHQEDANVVISALRRRGYSVVQRSTNTDPLIHVQIGPFASRKEAEAMKQRLSGDGYNAILK